MNVEVLAPPCIVCRERGIVIVDSDEYARYNRGTDAQVAFKTLDTDQRELLISGTHAHCWVKLYGSEG